MSSSFTIDQSCWIYMRPPGQPTDLWDWALRLSPQEVGDLDRVVRVVYSLPSVYPNPTRIIHDRPSNFRLAVSSRNAHDATWGNVRVRVGIVFDDGHIEHDEVMLDLRDATHPRVRELLELPASATLRLTIRNLYPNSALCFLQPHPHL